jgi:asparagine synthase (glutamine-hydrolysing)
MCGIAGIIGNNKQEITATMLAATRHRGPDDHGIYADEYCAIGMNRLAILDLSQAAHQPMSSNDGRYTIVYNGEIYNFKNIRNDLIQLGYTFKSHSDTEVLLNGYLAYGENILHKIRGMFAFVIWDKYEQKAFGARDHMGIKPFLYHFEKGSFSFCSEMKGLLQNQLIKKELSTEGLQLYLSYGYVGAPYTIIKNVNALLPGNSFTFQKGELKIKQYWDIPTFSKTEFSYEEAKSYLKKIICEKVEEELVSDVPLGLFLSGGLDSTVVLAAMRLAGKENIDTFSLGFVGMQGSEEAEAEIAARFYQTRHHTFMITGKTVKDEFEGFIEAMDQPCTDGLNIYLVSKYTRQQVTVALSGLGPDELFLGYKWQRSAIAPEWFNKPARLFINTLKPILKILWPGRYIGILNYLEDVQDPALYYKELNRLLSNKNVQQLMGYSFIPELNAAYISLYDDKTEKDVLSRISRMDMRLFMAARVLNISDTTSMYHSLEVRFPLIDKEIVEFSRKLPASYKLNMTKAKRIKPWSPYEGIESYEGSGVKRILYESFKNELPKDFGIRAKKGFKFPYELWTQKELKSFEKTAKFGENHITTTWARIILNQWANKNNVELPV